MICDARNHEREDHIYYFIQYHLLILANVKFKFILSSRPAALRSRVPRSLRRINVVHWCQIFVVLRFGLLAGWLGHAVVRLVEALPCKSEGRGFDFRLCRWDFSLT
jgi:hypothetical protein